MIEQITCSVVCHKFRYYEPFWRLIVNDVKAKRRGEHVVQSSANEARWSLIRWGLHLPLFGHMGGPFWHGCCGWGTQTGLQSFHYVRFSSYAKWLRPQSGLYYVRQAWPLVAPPSYWHLSRVGAFVQLHLPGWWKLIFWLYLMTARGGPCVLENALSFCFEVVHWPFYCRLWDGPDDNTWARNSSFSYLSLLVSWSKDCTYRSLSCWRLSMFSRQPK